ncbi:hypothetical protein QWJ41_04165 [Nocardioides sp. SOB44]|uniref:Uncharacterized protein n=1 Tax=Nocardioides cremeus TaxID=3058044 RepID=A0ABT8TM59_9ACTN|nr:hypothetical protein [Nocardioides cremeus]MDO3394901.1 hypothetical protein [Nocardioides cremeus]
MSIKQRGGSRVTLERAYMGGDGEVVVTFSSREHGVDDFLKMMQFWLPPEQYIEIHKAVSAR